MLAGSSGGASVSRGVKGRKIIIRIFVSDRGIQQKFKVLLVYIIKYFSGRVWLIDEEVGFQCIEGFMFKKLVGNDNAVKFIFDHYKNFAVAAVILAVGISLLFEEGESGFFEWMRIVSGTCVVFIGLFLIVVNERHGMRKLNEAKLKPVAHIAIILIYGLSMVAIVSRLVMHNFK
ncbi:hypothetical protein HX815_15040 [Pseudomonas sp. E6002]|uniref:hypothetical protein n=1 Tax=Pseudomonas sp. E6002 TaxID=2738820 RepID=UPI0015A4C7E8|nr:hypothetical protein [Pseudomonas sp. E6002]NWB41626.1 hypothetical protein [Pseudomonas sp. E6002]